MQDIGRRKEIREFPQDYEMTLSPMGIYRMLALNVDCLSDNLKLDDIEDIENTEIGAMIYLWDQVKYLEAFKNGISARTYKNLERLFNQKLPQANSVFIGKPIKTKLVDGYKLKVRVNPYILPRNDSGFALNISINGVECSFNRIEFGEDVETNKDYIKHFAPHLWELYDDLKEIDRVWVDYTTKEWKDMSHIDYIEKADKFFKGYGDKLKEFTEFRFGDGKKPTKRKTHKKRSKK